MNVASALRTPAHQAAPVSTINPAILCLAAALTLAAGWYDRSLLLPFGCIWAMQLLLKHPSDRIAFSIPFLAGWFLIDHGLYGGAEYLPQLQPYVGRETPWELLTAGNVWGPRYLASYPSVWTAEVTGVDLAVTWRFQLLTSMTLTGLVAHQVWAGSQAPRVPSAGERLLFGLGIVLTMQAVGTMMNGRLAPAYLGMAMILLGLIRWERRGRFGLAEALLVGIGIFPLSLMTSGTIFPALGVVIFASWRALQKHGFRRVRALAVIALVLTPALPFTYFGLMKNVVYFEDTEDGLWGVLGHGAGIVLTAGVLAFATVLAFAIVGGMVFLAFLRGLRGHLPSAPLVFWTIPIAATGGLFGFSTGSMALPAVAVVAMLAIRPGLGVRRTLAPRRPFGPTATRGTRR